MSLLDVVRQKIQAQQAERDARQADLDSIVEAASAENRDLNDDEAAKFAEAKSALVGADDELVALRAREAELIELDERRAAAAAVRPANAEVGSVSVRTEERTYRPDGEHSFLSDLFARDMRMGDRDAEERLYRHSMEHRATAVAGMAGAVPPAYLVDQYAAIARAGRPFLNSLNSLDLPPDGVSFVIPRGNTGTTAAQTVEGAGFTDGDLANADITSSVNLTTAKTDISRTLFMRGGAVVDQILFPDLMAAAEVQLNASCLTGNGTAPNHLGVLEVGSIESVTYTDASPTVTEAWPKLSDAIQRINSLRYMPATVIYMHPRRWGWITSATDTSGRPLFEFSTTPPNSVIGLGRAAEYGQVVGTLQGLPVVTDASIPTNLGAGTNEDRIIVARSTDILFWEDSVMQFSFEQALSTAPGQVRLAVGKFALFVPGRYPKSIAVISGTGLAAPTF